MAEMLKLSYRDFVIKMLKNLEKKTDNMNKQKFSKDVENFFKFYENTRQITLSQR